MSIIFERDFAGMFTEVVNKYLVKGMMFNVNSMSGSQGEKAKVDLTDGKDVYRIRLESDYASDDEFFRIDMMSIIVERHDDAYRADLSGFDTIWNGRGEVIERIDFFKLGEDTRKNVYTESFEDAKVALRKELDRYKSRKGKCRESRFMFDAIKQEELKKMVKSHKGYGKVKACSIKALEKKVYDDSISYRVHFHDRDPLTIKRIAR